MLHFYASASNYTEDSIRKIFIAMDAPKPKGVRVCYRGLWSRDADRYLQFFTLDKLNRSGLIQFESERDATDVRGSSCSCERMLIVMKALAIVNNYSDRGLIFKLSFSSSKF